MSDFRTGLIGPHDGVGQHDGASTTGVDRDGCHLWGVLRQAKTSRRGAGQSLASRSSKCHALSADQHPAGGTTGAHSRESPGSNGLRKPSQLMADRLFTVPTATVGAVVGILESGTLAELDLALRSWLELP